MFKKKILLGLMCVSILEANWYLKSAVRDIDVSEFYDKGFITYYDDHIVVEILNAGNSVLKLIIYDDKICRDTFMCLSSNEFNTKYINKDYKKDFLKQLFSKKDKVVKFKDKKNHIIIKISRD